MSPAAGWRYFKRGVCPDCGDSDCSLLVAVLEGHYYEDGERKVVRGTHLPLFPPICRDCTQNYALDAVCTTHRIPLRVKDASCKLCPGAPKPAKGSRPRG